jgi:hypothetical protein
MSAATTAGEAAKPAATTFKPVNLGDGGQPLSIGFSELDDDRRRAFFRGAAQETGAFLTDNERLLLTKLGMDERVTQGELIAPYLASFFSNLEHCQTPAQLQLSSRCSLNQMVLWNLMFMNGEHTKRRLAAQRNTHEYASATDLVRLTKALSVFDAPVAGPNVIGEETDQDILRLFTLVSAGVPASRLERDDDIVRLFTLS